MNKFTILYFFLLGSVFADVGSSGPQGALLVLPSQYSEASQSQKAENVEEVSQKIMERLRQEQGSNTGVYHVYLPDGKLQKVQFTTALLRSAPVGNFQGTSYAQQFSQNLKEFPGSTYPTEQLNQYASQRGSQEPNPVLAHFGRYQYDSLQQQKQYQQQQQFQQQRFQSQEQQPQEKSHNYVASVQFTDVDPIQPPIYSYQPSPLSRVLRYAPNF